MHHRNRRAHRAVATLSLALAAAGVAAVAVPGAASANDPQPQVRARIVGAHAARPRWRRATRFSPSARQRPCRRRSTSTSATTASPRSRSSAACIGDVDVRAGRGDDMVLIDETAGVCGAVHRHDPDDDQRAGRPRPPPRRPGAEDFRGGRGNDVVDGNRGNDTAALGADDDEFIWDPGDGSDTIEGRRRVRPDDVQRRRPATRRSPPSTTVAACASPRNVGNIVMDTDGRRAGRPSTPSGGSDFVEIDDLARTGVKTIDVDVGADARRRRADGIVDSVFVDGTEGNDDVDHRPAAAGNVSIVGLFTTVNITDAETTDRLLVRRSGRATTASTPRCSVPTRCTSTCSAVTATTSLLGGDGAENVPGRCRRRLRRRQPWQRHRRHGSRTTTSSCGIRATAATSSRARDGYDVMTFNGSSGDEIFATTSLGDRMAFTRNLGNIFMDTNDVEAIDLRGPRRCRPADAGRRHRHRARGVSYADLGRGHRRRQAATASSTPSPSSARLATTRSA